MLVSYRTLANIPRSREESVGLGESGLSRMAKAGRRARVLAQLRQRPRIALERPRNAAVLLPLIGRADAPELLFTRRASGISMAGQVAFPGGRVEPGDADRTATALREA